MKGSLEGMKKIVLLGALLMSAAAAGHAQESRQDFSISGFGLLAPQVYGNAVVPMTTTITTGVLGSYRYLLTPRVGLELNYGFSQDSIKYYAPSVVYPNGEVHTKNQELSGAFVYSRNYKNFNPFVEAGPGVMLFTPILDIGTHESGTKSSTNVGGIFGGGVAYEISPSFDIRAEYRGFVTKTPSFGVTQFETNKYYVISTPAIGIAYHF
ncbi:MAG: outer membrane beta-barrel protein [Janthinobacterium lividum]